MLGILFLIAIDLILCFLVGNYADQKGYNMGLWFFLAFITTPLVAFVLLLIMGDSTNSNAYYPQDNYSSNYNSSSSYHSSTNYVKPKKENKPKIKKLSGKEFFEKVSRDYKLYKNDIITLEKKESNYKKIVENLMSSHIEGNFEEFMHEIIDLLDENILYKEEFQRIKDLVLNKMELQNLNTSELATKYNETKSDLIKEELTIRGISLDFIEKNPNLLDYSDYELLSKYIESNDSAIKEILDNKDIYDEDYISKVRGLKKLNNNQLISRYLKEGEGSICEDELKYKEITTSTKVLIKKVDNFTLINLYRETGSAIAKDELINRDLNDFLK